jgi:hypothetical protein
MKRRDLIRQLRDAANDAALEFTSLRNTGGHEVFSLDGLRISIPNHREIAEGKAPHDRLCDRQQPNWERNGGRDHLPRDRDP